MQSFTMLAVAWGLGLLAAAPDRPNILVILTDDQRWDAMGCAGNRVVQTPNMDRLAREGVRFANVFVTTSLCSPSRASLLSGRYARQHGVRNNFTEYPNALPGYPTRLHEAGYETAYVGKWHMGEDNDDRRPGFDHWFSHRGQGNYFDNEFNDDGVRYFQNGGSATGGTLQRPPNGDVSSPARVATPSLFSYPVPINYTLSARYEW